MLAVSALHRLLAWSPRVGPCRRTSTAVFGGWRSSCEPQWLTKCGGSIPRSQPRPVHASHCRIHSLSAPRPPCIAISSSSSSSSSARSCWPSSCIRPPALPSLSPPPHLPNKHLHPTNTLTCPRTVVGQPSWRHSPRPLLLESTPTTAMPPPNGDPVPSRMAALRSTPTAQPTGEHAVRTASTAMSLQHIHSLVQPV